MTRADKAIRPPTINVLETCNMCGLCIRSCLTSALNSEEGDSNNPVLVGRAEKCLECRACEQICPKNAILVDPF
ncbi:MAG: 4Fe-4S dicluster domain-containing protein [Candidatus Hodarchaeales archaeon]